MHRITGKLLGAAALMALLISACVPITPVTPEGNVPPPTTPTAAPSMSVDPGETEAAGLSGVNWQLVEYLNPNNEMVTPTTEATLSFLEGQAAGSAGCNSFSANYRLDGSTLTFDQPVSTLMACEEGVMAQEEDVLNRLVQTQSFAVVDGQLQLLAGDGTILLTFAPLEATSLTGTTWVATMVNNGQQAVSSLLEGSELTAQFGEDGRLNGSSGCNTYTTTYTVEEDRISIRPPASTRMACSTPEGVMEQERSYLQAIATAATFTIQGEVLELHSADGALVASFTAGQ